MTYYGAKEMAASFRTVRGNTITIAEEIPEESYGFRATPDTRTVAETLAHIALSTRMPEQLHFIERRRTVAGFDWVTFFAKLEAEAAIPRSKNELIELLRQEGDRFAAHLEGADEAFLAEDLEFPPNAAPRSKCRMEVLLSPKEHEMHHRAQLMVVQRMLGLKPHLTRRLEENIAAMRAARTAR